MPSKMGNGMQLSKRQRDRLLDKYISLERKLDVASDRKGARIIHELGRLEMLYDITTDEVQARREELRHLRDG
ncbi:hypothetical protein LCGC14_2151240 [marine sediment metagenome]|uniref:Uncharacterized protein n=1 Tax=marine sediment metagenome TaxID=412755 RepID=A0A0F9G8K5_9ZZZZ